MATVYTPDDYDQYNVLKTPAILIIACLFLAKYPILMALPAVPAMDAQYLGKFAKEHFDWFILVFSSIPALLVMGAMVRRAPKGGAKARKIWAYGWQLLVFATVAELALLIAYVLTGKQKLTEFNLIVAYIDAMLLIYLVRASRARDVFKEFPEPEKKKSGIPSEQKQTQTDSGEAGTTHGS